MTKFLMVGVVWMVITMGLSRPQTGYQYATIVEQTNTFGGLDNWNWSYRSSDGAYRQESGSLVDEAPEVSGTYSWTAPDGSVFTVTYRAGKDGYTAETRPGRLNEGSQQTLKG